jgi:hypothetical protein
MTSNTTLMVVGALFAAIKTLVLLDRLGRVDDANAIAAGAFDHGDLNRHDGVS